MRLTVHVGRRMRSWHRDLAARLERAGHEVSIVVDVAHSERTSRIGVAVLAFESSVFRKTAHRLAPIEHVSKPSFDPKNAELHLVLAGAAPPNASWIQPKLDGVAGEAVLVNSLLGGQSPVVTICDHGHRILTAGRPAVENPFVLSHAVDGLLDRLITLLVKAVEVVEISTTPHVPNFDTEPVTPSIRALFLARALRHKVRRRFGAMKGRPDHWRIALRHVPMDASRSSLDRLAEGFVGIEDDGERFYADPFCFEQAGLRHLFFEDFPYASQRGVISAVSVGAEGAVSAPRVVLEQPVHLSYPFVFRDGEHIYMLPETSGARCIQLFRAEPFPDRWVPDRILVDSVIASDATLVQHEGRYWIFATITEPGGSTWDQLALFHAPTLFGPWTPHPLNPVLIDSGSARPAGAMWHEAGQLMRVAQDCRTGYGAGLAICRVDRLDPDGYAQTIVRRIGPPDGFGATGIHTLNRCGDLEVIDMKVPHPR